MPSTASASTGDRPGQTIANPFCQFISRDPQTGTPQVTRGSFQNVGKIKTSGVDFSIDWSADLADMGMASVPGALSLNLATTYLDSFETQDIAGAPVLDFAGTVGPQGQPGQFRFKTFTTVGYSTGGVSAARWAPAFGKCRSKPAQPNTTFGARAITTLWTSRATNHPDVPAALRRQNLSIRPESRTPTRLRRLVRSASSWRR
jgi:hypothetical protein